MVVVTLLLFSIMVPDLQAQTTVKTDPANIDFHQMFLNHSAIMLVVDAETGNIIHANRAASEFYGYTITELESMNKRNIIVASPEDIASAMESAREGNVDLFTLSHRLADGELRTVEVRVHPYANGNQILFWAIITDVTREAQLNRLTKLLLALLGALLLGALVIGTFTHRKHQELQARTEDRLRRMSYRDSLTGLYNRRFFEEELKRLDTAPNLPISIIAGDVNDLKIVNDIYGHTTGDVLLQKVSGALKATCRKDEIIARLGGDEFVILLPKTEPGDAQALLARIRQQVAKKQVKSIQCSISLGRATKTRPGEDISAVLQEAENAMYTDKTLHGNSIKSATVSSLIRTLHAESPDERKHSGKVSKICGEIGRALRLSAVQQSRLEDAAFIHNIGKVALDSHDESCDPLVENAEEIRRHPLVGFRILNSVDDAVELAEPVLYQYERWDGSGFPKGLKGEEIPLLARIIAVANCYDLLTRGSPNQKPMSGEQAMQEIQKHTGTLFDPKIVEVLTKLVRKGVLE